MIHKKQMYAKSVWHLYDTVPYVNILHGMHNNNNNLTQTLIQPHFALPVVQYKVLSSMVAIK